VCVCVYVCVMQVCRCAVVDVHVCGAVCMCMCVLCGVKYVRMTHTHLVLCKTILSPVVFLIINKAGRWDCHLLYSMSS